MFVPEHLLEKQEKIKQKPGISGYLFCWTLNMSKIFVKTFGAIILIYSENHPQTSSKLRVKFPLFYQCCGIKEPLPFCHFIF